MFITVSESKRASLERAFTHRPYAYNGINSHTARNKSSFSCKRFFMKYKLIPKLLAITSTSPYPLYTTCRFFLRIYTPYE